MKEWRVCNEKKCWPEIISIGYLSTEGDGSKWNAEETSPPFPAPFHAPFHVPFFVPFHALFPLRSPLRCTSRSTLCSPLRSPLRCTLLAPLRFTLRFPLRFPLRSTLHYPLGIPVYSLHCRQKKTKFYLLITLDNYWKCSTLLISYRCPGLSQIVR